jgi:coenzyme F420 biosynthesis associated uncharacterized protein
VSEFVAWETAASVAKKVARQQSILTEYERRSLESDFEGMTVEAEELVAAETGLRSLAGNARSRVANRAEWIDANVASFQRLLRPVLSKLDDKLDAGGRATLLPIQASRQLAGAEVGTVLGWMATRVLGQYDQLIIEEESPEDQDMVYYVGPNVVGVERRHGFPPGEFRLWLALHEVTHRAQFTGIPWMRPHFLGLVESAMAGIDPDPKALFSALRQAADGARGGHNPLEDGGLLALIATPEQKVAIQRIGGMMSLLEGHGDVTMDRAARDRIPSAERFSRVLRQRRKLRGYSKLLAVLTGLDAKLRQYEQGERFIEVVEARGGPELLARAWEKPEHLPSLDEIRRPDSWIARIESAPAEESSQPSQRSRIEAPDSDGPAGAA